MARQGAAIAHHPELNELLLYGGQDPTGELKSDLWRLELRTLTWTQAAASGPDARQGAALVPGPKAEVYLMGGENAQGPVPLEAGSLAGNLVTGTWTQAASPPLSAFLEVDGPAAQGVHTPGAPVIYDLADPDLAGRLGRLVQVRLQNPGNNLMAVAIATRSSALPKVTSPDPEGVLTLSMHQGEQWRILVASRPGAAQGGDLTYALSASAAALGSELGWLDIPPFERFDVQGDIVYAAEWDRLGLYQRQGHGLVEVGGLGFPGLGPVMDVVARGKWAYVADLHNGLVVVDISDPTNPVKAGQEWVLGMAESVAVQGDRAYVATGLLGVQVVDISDPTQPMWVETIQVDDVALDVTVAGHLLLVSALPHGVELFSVDAQGRAQKLGRYHASGPVDDTAYYGGYLYAKTWDQVLEVVDVRDPTRPRLSELVPFGAADKEVSLRTGHDLAVLPDEWHGLGVFDVE